MGLGPSAELPLMAAFRQRRFVRQKERQRLLPPPLVEELDVTEQFVVFQHVTQWAYQYLA